MQLAIGTTLVFRFSTRALAFFSPQLKLWQLNLSAKPCETVAVVLIHFSLLLQGKVVQVVRTTSDGKYFHGRSLSQRGDGSASG